MYLTKKLALTAKTFCANSKPNIILVDLYNDELSDIEREETYVLVVCEVCEQTFRIAAQLENCGVKNIILVSYFCSQGSANLFLKEHKYAKLLSAFIFTDSELTPSLFSKNNLNKKMQEMQIEALELFKLKMKNY